MRANFHLTLPLAPSRPQCEVYRAPGDGLRAVVVSDVMTSIQSICDQRSLQCCVDRVHDAEAVQCSPAIVQGLIAAVEASEQVQLPFEDTSGFACSRWPEYACVSTWLLLKPSPCPALFYFALCV